MMERRMWDFQHALRQFPNISNEILFKLESRNADLDRLMDMNASEIGQIVGHPKMGKMVEKMVKEFPNLEIDVSIHPITR
jgi:hypothetical protein